MAPLSKAAFLITLAIWGAISYRLYAEQRWADLILVAFMASWTLLFINDDVGDKKVQPEDRG